MPAFTVTSNDVNNPDHGYTGTAIRVRCANTDGGITVHVRDPHAAEEWVDLPPGYDHIFIRSGIAQGPIDVYADSGSPVVLFNPIG
jgi:hypothetical protein